MTTTALPLQISRYEVLAELGSGAMGVVYKARDPLIDRLVALKTIGVEQVGADALAFRQRFFREARSAGGLNHPNIVTIHDVGESGSVAYIAMEFLGGQSLREILDSGTVLPIARIADIAAQIADGLAFAHQKGIVHRDIKPANIMVLDNGVVKITDFGIALLPSGTRTLAGTVFGSPKYISPERVRGDHVDGRSDIFSLGAVLYELLTGLPPFTGTDLNSLLYQILSVMPMAPSSRNRKIPHAFDFIVATALAKDPAERYGNAGAMAADLRNFAGLEARATPPVSPPAEAAAAALSTAPAPAPPAAPPPVPAPAMAAESSPAPPPRPVPAEALSAVREAVPPPVPDAPAPVAMPEVLVPMLEAPPPPLLPTGPAVVPPPWRNPTLLAIPALLLALLAGVTLWPRGTGPSAPAPPPVVAATGETPAKAPATPAPPAVQAAPAVAPVAPPTTVAATAATATSPAAAAAAKPEPAAARPTAVLGIAIAPWGEVYVNGRKMGVSPPLTELRLAPGKYAVEIRNTTFPPYRETIDLLTQNSIRIRHKFQ